MAKTNKTNWQKAVEELLKNNVSQKEIDDAMVNATDNKSKFESLTELLNKNNIVIKRSKRNVADDTPTLKEFFGAYVAQLLIKRKELYNSIKDIDITEFANKKCIDLTEDELRKIIKYSNVKEIKEKINSIDIKLEKSGFKVL